MKVTKHTGLWIAKLTWYQALFRFAPLAWSTVIKSMVLALPEQDFLNHLVTVLWSTVFTFNTINVFDCFSSILGLFKFKAQVPKLNTIAYSSVRLSNHTSEARNNISAHELPQYYQPQGIYTKAWTASVTWYKCHKLPKYCKTFNSF